MKSARLSLLLVGLVPPEAGGSISCGVASHVLELAQQAAVRGYETSILAPLRPGAKVSAAGIRMIDATRSRPARLLSGGKAAFRLGGRSRFLSSLGLKDRVAILSWTERIRAAIEITRADIIHIHPFSHPVGPGLSELPKGIPVVFTDHGFWQDLQDEDDLAKIRETARLATAVVAVSRYCLDRQDQLGLKFGGTREVISNAITPDPIGTGRGSQMKGRKRVLFVAGVEPVTRKGLDILIRAFAESTKLKSEAELHVITDEETGRWAAGSMAAEGIAGDVFPLRPRREIAAAYREADLLALPSRSEAFPIVFLEALAAGTPVIGFAPAVEELRERLGEDAGLPFDAGLETPAELARKLLLLLHRQTDRDGLAARTATAFSWNVLFPAFDRLYRRLRSV